MLKPEHSLLTDDAPDHVIEAAAAKERRDAFNGAPAWHNLPLVWTSSRAGLYDFLRIPSPVLSEAALAAIKASQAAEGTDRHAALQERANALFAEETAGKGMGHVRNASIILWLAAHQPKDWRTLAHDRAALLVAIDEWIDENVDPGEIQEMAEVTNKLLSDADSTRAISRPRNPNPDEAGN